jgi:hypothetical protein
MAFRGDAMSKSSKWSGLLAGIALCALAGPAWSASSAPGGPGKVAQLAATQPSWQLDAGVPNSCSVVAPGNLNTTVDINNPADGSEQGVLSVQGVGNVGNTFDTSFLGVSINNGFSIFVTSGYSVPAHTPITLVITTFKLPNYLGGVSFVDTHTWDCTTGQFISPPTAAPIPALDDWSLLLLAGLLLAAAIAVRRRRG